MGVGTPTLFYPSGIAHDKVAGSTLLPRLPTWIAGLLTRIEGLHESGILIISGRIVDHPVAGEVEIVTIITGQTKKPKPLLIVVQQGS